MSAVVSLDAALRDARLFRGGRVLCERRDGLPSGLAALDAALPWGGFPRGALTELLHARAGIGELDLLLPALRELLAREPQRRIALVAPPWLPYAPALVQAGLPLARIIWIAPVAARVLWSAEQCLRAGCLAGVLAWSPTGDDRALRRLQLAAAQGDSHAWLFRPLQQRVNASPAALRLVVARETIEVLKCRGAVLRGEFPRDPVSATFAPSPSPPGRGVGVRVCPERGSGLLADTAFPASSPAFFECIDPATAIILRDRPAASSSEPPPVPGPSPQPLSRGERGSPRSLREQPAGSSSESPPVPGPSPQPLSRGERGRPRGRSRLLPAHPRSALPLPALPLPALPLPAPSAFPDALAAPPGSRVPGPGSRLPHPQQSLFPPTPTPPARP
jgi:hypothetical protein